MNIENVARKTVCGFPWIFCCFANLLAAEIFFLDVTNRTWDESHSFCDSLQLRMITLHTEEKYQRIVAFLRNERVNQKIWLGLRLADGTENEADFRWVDGKAISWIAWDEDDPNGLDYKKCVSLRMTDNALFDTKYCANQYYTVCEEKDVLSTKNRRRSSFMQVSSVGVPATIPSTIVDDVRHKTECAAGCMKESNCVEFSVIDSQCYIFTRYGKAYRPCDVKHKCYSYRRKGINPSR